MYIISSKAKRCHWHTDTTDRLLAYKSCKSPSLARFEICAAPRCYWLVEQNRTLHPDKHTDPSLTNMQIYNTPQDGNSSCQTTLNCTAHWQCSWQMSTSFIAARLPHLPVSPHPTQYQTMTAATTQSSWFLHAVLVCVRCRHCPFRNIHTCNWATAAAVSCNRATDTGCAAVWAGSGGCDSLRHRCDVVTVTVGAECSSTSWCWYCNCTCCVISRIRSGYSCDSSDRTWNSPSHHVHYFTLCVHNETYSQNSNF
jgi:hypothetical protein